jgi:hypothetical protein
MFCFKPHIYVNISMSQKLRRYFKIAIKSLGASQESPGSMYNGTNIREIRKVSL